MISGSLKPYLPLVNLKADFSCISTTNCQVLRYEPSRQPAYKRKSMCLSRRFEYHFINTTSKTDKGKRTKDVNEAAKLWGKWSRIWQASALFCDSGFPVYQRKNPKQTAITEESESIRRMCKIDLFISSSRRPATT